MFIMKLTKVLIKLKGRKVRLKKGYKIENSSGKKSQYFQDELNLTIYHLS